MAMHARQILFQRSLVKFVSHSTPIERHLLAGKPLTDTERDLIFNTVLILQASLEVWQKKFSKRRKLRRHEH